MTDQATNPLSGSEVQRLRKTLGYSQTDFAKALNTSQTLVSRWERGVATLTTVEEAKMLALPKAEPKKRTHRRRPCPKCGYQPTPAQKAE